MGLDLLFIKTKTHINSYDDIIDLDDDEIIPFNTKEFVEYIKNNFKIENEDESEECIIAAYNEDVIEFYFDEDETMTSVAGTLHSEDYESGNCAGFLGSICKHFGCRVIDVSENVFLDF